MQPWAAAWAGIRAGVDLGHGETEKPRGINPREWYLQKYERRNNSGEYGDNR